MKRRHRCPREPGCAGSGWCVTTGCSIDVRRRSTIAMYSLTNSASASETVGAREKTRILLIASLVSSLIMLDSNIVAVSLPSIGRALGASFVDIEWVVSAYVLTYAALLLAAGNYADLHGRKGSMVAG